MATQPEKIRLACSNAVEGRAAQPFDPADGVQDTALLNSCVVCDSKTNMTCSNCSTHYCNQDCLKADWVHHKALCQTLKSGFEIRDGHKNHVRAILFPYDAKKPTWVWIHLKPLDLSIMRALGITTKRPLTKAVNKLEMEDVNPSLRHRKIGRGLRRFAAPGVVHDHSRINGSIAALASIGSLEMFFGSALFLSFRTVETAEGAQEIHYEHASGRDLRMIVEWYCTNLRNPCVSASRRLPIRSYGQPQDEKALWPAVKIYCDGDLERLPVLAGRNVERVEHVQVLSKDYLGQRTEPILAEMLGLPWLVQLCPGTDDPIQDSEAVSFYYNSLARFCVPEEPEYFTYVHGENKAVLAQPSHRRLVSSGTVLVIHREGCLIRDKHIQCFHDFVISCLAECVAIASGLALEDIRQEDIFVDSEQFMELITRERFESFWEHWIIGQLTEQAAYLFPSPYNTINKVETDVVEAAVEQEDVTEVVEKVESLVFPEES